MEKITPIDIQHKAFKKALQGYDRTEVDSFLDEIIETLEDGAQQRTALEAEIADLKERVSHFKAIEDSLQNTLVLAQRTADETKASAHKEADLIREQARLQNDREVAGYNEAIADVRREQQRAVEATEKARSELRSLLMTHLALLERAEAPKGEKPEPVAPAATQNGEVVPNAEPGPKAVPDADTTRITVY